ncbi:MAG TPA: cadherin domain-containing protein [Allosphingosinicella sp.]
MAGFASGGFIVVWCTTDTTQDGAGRSIKAQRYDSFGVAVGPEILVNSSAAGDQRAPSVTTLASGGYVISWETTDTIQDGAGTAIKGQLYDSTGTAVGSEFRVNTQVVADQTRSAITGLDGGGFVVTWQTADSAQDGSSTAIKGQIYSAAGVAVGSEFLVNTGAIGNESSPSVTSLTGGGFVATWTLGSGTSADIYAQVFNASGLKTGGMFRVNSTTSFNQDFPSVTELSDGRFVVTWTSYSSLSTNDNEIRARIFSATGVPIGNDFAVSTARFHPDSGAFAGLSSPDIAELPDGGFLVTWTFSGTDPNGSSIRGQYFSSSGARVGGEVLISTAAGRTEGNSEIAVDGNGMIFAVWDSANSAFTDYDIRGQILTPTGAPDITSNGGDSFAALTIMENMTSVTTVVASDPEGSPVTYSIVGGADAARFRINSSNGFLTLLAPLNYEQRLDAGGNNVYDVVVQASDGVNSDIQAIAVTISNVNEPVAINGSQNAFQYVENGTGTVATFNATDPDGDPLTWSIVGGADAAKFTIDSSGTIRFVASPDFETPTDSGGNNIYDLVIKVSDGSLWETRALTVEVLNSNEGPVIVSGGGGSAYALSVAENSTLVTTIVGDDPDATNGPITYSIVGGADSARFVIQSQTGQLFFVSGRNFEAPTDSNGDNVYEVIVAVSDGFSPADTQALSVTVTNVNEAVTITSNGGGASAGLSVAEDSLAVTTVVATDLDGTAPTYSIAGGADAALFTIDAVTGALRFVTAPDYEAPADAGGDNVYNVVVAAGDGSLSDTQAIAVTVTNVNQGLSIVSNGGGDSATVAAVENGLAVTTVAAVDADGTSPSYAIAGGDDAARFTIDAATGALSFVSAPDFEAPEDWDGDNVYRVVVAATDGSFTDSQSLDVVVGNANEGVTITSNGGGGSAAITLAENGLAVTIVAATDVDGTAPTYSIAGGADAALFAIDSVTGALRFVTAPDREAPADADGDNVYDVVVAAGDGSFSDSQALAVTVTNVNDVVPVIAFWNSDSISMAMSEGHAQLINLDASDAEGDPVSFSLSGIDASRFAVDAVTGVVTFLSTPDYESPGSTAGTNIYYVTVTASDGLLTDTLSIQVNIWNLNEGVTITSGPAISVAENGSEIRIVTAVDEDGTSPTFSITGGADASKFLIDPATGQLSFASLPDYEAPGDADGDNVYDLVVTASDGSFSDSQALAVAVADVDEDIAFAPLGAFSVAENMSAVGAVSATDPDGRPMLYSIAGGADSSRFAIDATTGALSFVSAPDYEAPADADGDNVYDVVVAASDGVFAHTQVVTVTVGNANEGVAITSGGGGASASLSLVENGLVVATVQAVDGDGTSPTYSIAGGGDAALFRIDAATGALSFIAVPDFEAPGDSGGDNVYEILVAASDGSFTDTQALSIAVGNADELPVFTSSATVARAENGSASHIVTAVDPDGTGTIAYSIAGGADASDFWIDAATGVLTYIGIPDHEAPGDSDGDNVYEILVSASDGTGASTQAVYFSISDVNEAPRIVSNGGGTSASLSIDEGQTAIATIAAVDGEGSSVTYSISGGPDADRFVIDPVTGVLSLIAAPDYEAPADAFEDNFYSVIVSASDGVLSGWQSVQVSVSNVNEGLSITSGQSFSIVENAAAVTSIAAVDVDGDTLSYAISGGADASLFEIDAATGALRFIAAPDFEAPADAGGDNVYELTVSASDGSFTDSRAISVAVTNANDIAPVISFYPDSVTWNIPENLAYLLEIRATDAEADAISYSLSGPDASLFTIDSVTGALAWASPQDFETWADNGFQPYHVNVVASDGLLSDTLAITINLVNVNEGPVITSNGGGSSASVTIGESQVAVTNVTAVDADRTAPAFSIVGGADAALFAIDPATGALRFISAPDFEAPGDSNGDNVYDLLVLASDGSLFDTQAIAVTVADGNDGPSITSGNLLANENSLGAGSVAASDPDGDALTYAIAGGADAARFSIDPATGALSFLSAPDYEQPTDSGFDNVYELIVSASDGSFTASRAISVTVGNVNEGVTITSGGGGAGFSLPVAENGRFVTQIDAKDGDGGPVAYAIVGGADAALFTIDSSTGALEFVTAPNFEAPGDSGGNNVYDVVVAASDGTFTDSQALAVSVTNVNEAVTITSGGGGASTSVSVAENGLAVASIAATDADGQSVAYAIAGGADAARFTIDSATGALRFVAAPNHEAPADAGANNVYDVIVSASDGSFSDTQALAVTVTNVREGNTITGTSGGNTISTTTSVNGQPRATELEDTISGMGGNDTILGAGGDDIIDGGTGSDVITGGLGADLLTGGAAADRFTYNSVNESSVAAPDTITDFSRGEGDKISLSAIDANSIAANNQAFTFIGTNAFSGVAGQLRYEIVGGETRVSGDVNGDGVADFLIQLSDPVTLISSDFIL